MGPINTHLNLVSIQTGSTLFPKMTLPITLDQLQPDPIRISTSSLLPKSTR